MRTSMHLNYVWKQRRPQGVLTQHKAHFSQHNNCVCVLVVNMFALCI